MDLTPDIVLQAYACGIFPMAERAKAQELFWFDPPLRGIIPLDDRFHVPRRLTRAMKRAPFVFTHDRAFEDVIRACAAPRPYAKETWINQEILSLYTALFHRGAAHSVEVWDGEELVGGLYGVHLGAAFFGESMFSLKTDASKIALVHLVTHLRSRGFLLLDAQFLTDHLAQFGAVEIIRQTYHEALAAALAQNAEF